MVIELRRGRGARGGSVRSIHLARAALLVNFATIRCRVGFPMLGQYSVSITIADVAEQVPASSSWARLLCPEQIHIASSRGGLSRSSCCDSGVSLSPLLDLSKCHPVSLLFSRICSLAVPSACTFFGQLLAMSISSLGAQSSSSKNIR